MGGFAVSSAEDTLYILDFVTVRQRTTAVTVDLDDAAVADYFDAAVDAGLQPSRFARIWCHTHPGDSPEPSGTDEQTFARVFGSCDWSIMFILSRTGCTYARLAFAAGPGGSIKLPVSVDWEAWPQAVLEAPKEIAELLTRWAVEFEQNVQPVSFPRLVGEDDADEWWWTGMEELHHQPAASEFVEQEAMPVAVAGEEVRR